MMRKAVVLFTAAAALAEQATALSHRHLHGQVEKRDPQAHYVTVWHTVFVTAGQEAAQHPPTSVEHQGRPTVHSTTVVVVPTEEAPVEEEFAAPVPTTLSKVTKPKPTEEATPEEATEETPDAATDDTSAKAIGFNKRGLAYNSATLANNFGATCQKCGWGWNWDSISNGLNSKFSFVPMLWDDTPNHTNSWKANVETSISQGSKAIFSFNEPDNGGQSNMTPQRAANSHKQWLNPYAGRVQIGAPAITNSGNAGEGVQWLKNFFAACNGGCRVDFCPVHWYSGVQWKETLFDHLRAAHDACGGRPIWLTEFAPVDGSNGDKDAFMRSIIPRLDSLSYLDAYSYFMVSTDRLMTGTNSLSSYGQVYATI